MVKYPIFVAKTLYSRPDLWELIHYAESFDEPTLMELSHGEVCPKMLSMRHGIIAGNIYGHLWTFVRAAKLGHVMQEVHFCAPGDPYNDRAPDVAFVSAGRGLPIIEQGTAPFMPDLAVEVKPGDYSPKDLYPKAEYYLQNGTQLVWLVYPDQHEVKVCTLNPKRDLGVATFSAGESLSGGALLPGFVLPLTDIFGD